MTTNTQTDHSSSDNRIVNYMNKKKEITREVTDAAREFAFSVIDELTVLIKDLSLDGERIRWTDYVSSTPEYLKWTAVAIQTATGVRHPDVPEAVAEDLQNTFKALTGHLDVYDFAVEHEPIMGTWRVQFRARALEAALLEELDLYLAEPISVHFDLQDESPGVYVSGIEFLDSADIQRYHGIFFRFLKPALVWLQFRSSDGNLSG